ncbi:glycosyltransferase family 2 protein [Candidatus Bipolaricaulota bacterium]|nr:glycosyltransferase family 2 protein [Candidatus Bipolaricaulota bacterium]
MISVIILTWNSGDHIEECLTSLFDEIERAGRRVEVFVIDGNSRDETLEILSQFEKEHDQLNVITLRKNMGTTVSRNIGIDKSKGEFLLFLDSDTVIKPGLLSTLPETLEENQKIGVLAPRLLYKDGTIQPSCKKFPTLPIKLTKFIPLENLRQWASNRELYRKEIYSKSFDKPIEVDHCISAVWLVRRKVMEEIGGFDERIFYAPEDVDLCLRTWLAGYKVIYQPQVEVIHETQRIAYRNLRLMWKHVKGLFYFFRKYNYTFKREKIYERISNRNEDFNRGK